MKLCMNGALTIGTLDGANIEIRDAVGPENFFLFGLTAAEALERRRSGIPGQVACDACPELRTVVDLVSSAGFFAPEDPALFKPLVDTLLGRDEYLVMTDYVAYAECQRQVGEAFHDVESWTRKAALNIARVGAFSSDRTVREYAREIWKIEPTEVVLDPYDGGVAAAARIAARAAAEASTTEA